MTIARRLFLFCVLLLAACREQIVHDLAENEANRLLTKLSQFEVLAEKEKQADGRWALAVDEKDVVRAINHLNDTRLLRDSPDNYNEQSSIISSREDQKFRYERSLSREIETTLSSIEGVLEARVHLNMPPTDPLFGNPINNVKGSASVLLVASDDFQTNSKDVAGLVAGASGIEAALIQVIINKSIATPSDFQKPSKPVEANVIARVDKNVTHVFAIDWLDYKVQVAASLLILGIATVFFGFRKFKSQSPKLQPASTRTIGAI